MSEATTTETKKVLHVGCGHPDPRKVHPMFQGYQEIRLDIDPAVTPDIIGDIVDMNAVADESVDGVWSSHNLEHLFAHQVPLALREFFRVLKPGGVALVTMPDIQEVAALIAQGKLEDTAYVSPAGPIAPLDMCYGHRASIERGNHFMAHRTAFTAQTLGQKLHDAGFINIQLEKGNFALWGLGRKPG